MSNRLAGDRQSVGKADESCAKTAAYPCDDYFDHVGPGVWRIMRLIWRLCHPALFCGVGIMARTQDRIPCPIIQRIWRAACRALLRWGLSGDAA